MYWKVFHLGTALGNTLIGSKYSGQCLIQLTLQLASQLWLQIRTTWELRKTKKQKTFSWASPKDYWIRVWSMLQRTGYSDSYWALQRCAWIELIFLEELWVYTANWALTKEKETLEKERERERNPSHGSKTVGFLPWLLWPENMDLLSMAPASGMQNPSPLLRRKY